MKNTTQRYYRHNSFTSQHRVFSVLIQLHKKHSILQVVDQDNIHTRNHDWPYLGGIALKGGYNFRPYEDFIIQPSLMVAYSYIKSKDYKSSGGATVSSKGVNMFQVAPAVKLIKVFDDKLKGYIDVVGYVNGQSKVDAVTGAGNLLPDAKQKPYVKYNLGAEKAWGDGRFSGYVEAGVHSGSRDGYNVGFGFKYKLGKKTRSLNSVNYKNGSVDSYSF